MSDDTYTPDRLIEFLRQSPAQGLLNPAVAKSRLTAIEQVFSELNDGEKADIRLIDVEHLCARLHKIQGSTIRPEVVDLYKSRVKAALVDYFAWLENSKSFASVGGDASRRDKRDASSEQEHAAERRALEEIALSTSDRAADLVSIPLRENVTIFVANLPLDLTDQEARKISRVIEAFAQPVRAGKSHAQ